MFAMLIAQLAASRSAGGCWVLLGAGCCWVLVGARGCWWVLVGAACDARQGAIHEPTSFKDPLLNRAG